MAKTWFDIYFDSDTQAVFIECNAEQREKAEFITTMMSNRSDIRFDRYDYNDGNLWFAHECTYGEAKLIMKKMRWYATHYDRKVA